MLLTLANSMDNPTVDDILKIIAVSGGILIAVVAIIFSTIAKMVTGANAERTKREIAAYISEGSMTTEEGERILQAGPTCKWPRPRA